MLWQNELNWPVLSCPIQWKALIHSRDSSSGLDLICHLNLLLYIPSSCMWKMLGCFPVIPTLWRNLYAFLKACLCACAWLSAGMWRSLRLCQFGIPHACLQSRLCCLHVWCRYAHCWHITACFACPGSQSASHFICASLSSMNANWALTITLNVDPLRALALRIKSFCLERLAMQFFWHKMKVRFFLQAVSLCQHHSDGNEMCAVMPRKTLQS